MRQVSERGHDELGIADDRQQRQQRSELVAEACGSNSARQHVGVVGRAVGDEDSSGSEDG